MPTVRHQQRVPLAAVLDAAIRTPLIRLDLDQAAKHGGRRELDLELEVLQPIGSRRPCRRTSRGNRNASRWSP
ncbi:MAG: hypothetical protein ABJA98_00340 [Acidobacteriota bacterium]